MTPRPADFKDLFLDWLRMVGTPGAQGLCLWRAHHVQSLQEIAVLAEELGYAVASAELPANLSGFAQVIDGTPFIVVNRTTHPTHQHYTIAHELAHHFLHLHPHAVSTNRFDLPYEVFVEMQAQLFAATLLLTIRNEHERNEMLQHNRDAFVLPYALLLITTGLGVSVGLAYFLSWLFSPRTSHTGAGTWIPPRPSAGSTPASPAATN